MAERRSLGAALELSPEQRAFIQGSTVKSRISKPSSIIESSNTTTTAEAPQPQSAPLATSVQRIEHSRRKRQARAPLPPEDELLLGVAGLLVPLTTRLQPATAAALKRAGLEQKLRGLCPSTVQEIAEEAIQQWLHDHGFVA